MAGTKESEKHFPTRWVTGRERERDLGIEKGGGVMSAARETGGLLP